MHGTEEAINNEYFCKMMIMIMLMIWETLRHYFFGLCLYTYGVWNICFFYFVDISVYTITSLFETAISFILLWDYIDVHIVHI